MTFTILPVSLIAALLVTAVIAYFLGGKLTHRLPAILIAGLALPIVVMIAGYYGVAT